MAVRNDFSAGEVLAAADLNDTFGSKVDYATPTNAQTGTAYTFVADDAERLTTASNGSAVTLTIPPASSVAWPDNTVLRVVNYGAGPVTIDGGSGVTVTNTASTIAQYGAAVAIRTGSDAWTVVPFGGGDVPAATVSSPAATGQYTDGSGDTWDYYTFNASGTLTVDTAGLADILIVAGGGGGGRSQAGNYAGGGGGAGGYSYAPSFYLETGSHTVTVGAGGAGVGYGTGTRFGVFGTPSGGPGGDGDNASGLRGGSGGGGTGRQGGNATSSGGAALIPGHGNDGGGATGGGANAGGGGGAGSAGALNAAGAGLASSITGTSVTRAAGGLPDNGTTGAANTGNGGGGGRYSLTEVGRPGGSGVVIVRVKV